EGNGFTNSQRVGLEIWYKAAGDNARFHMYVTPQRIGYATDWYKIFGASGRDSLWSTWGLVHDPDCHPPKQDEAAASFGFDICEAAGGEQGLLAFVGKSGYQDPGCVVSGSFVKEDCDFGFGTSAGAVGYRKYPNPKFVAENWPGWDKWAPQDASVEPPFLF